MDQTKRPRRWRSSRPTREQSRRKGCAVMKSHPCFHKYSCNLQLETPLAAIAANREGYLLGTGLTPSRRHAGSGQCPVRSETVRPFVFGGMIGGGEGCRSWPGEQRQRGTRHRASAHRGLRVCVARHGAYRGWCRCDWTDGGSGRDYWWKSSFCSGARSRSFWW